MLTTVSREEKKQEICAMCYANQKLPVKRICILGLTGNTPSKTKFIYKKKTLITRNHYPLIIIQLWQRLLDYSLPVEQLCLLRSCTRNMQCCIVFVKDVKEKK